MIERQRVSFGTWRISIALLAAVAVAGGMSGGSCGTTPPPIDDGGIDNNQPVDPPTTQPDSDGAQNTPPVVTFQWPFAPVSIQAGTSVTVQWTTRDAEDAARVSIFVRNSQGEDAAIASGVVGTPPLSTHSQVWSTGTFPPGAYQVIAISNDSRNPPQINIAGGIVTIQPRPTDPGNPPDPQQPPNEIPTLQFTSPAISTVVNQGETVDIAYRFRDSGPRIKITLKVDPDAMDDNGNEITLVDREYDGMPENQTDTYPWVTSVPAGQYRVYGEIDDMSNLPDHRIRVLASGIVRVLPPGTTPENGPPSIAVVFPVSDAGVSQDDTLDLIFSVSDPNSDTDNLTISYLFDRDNNPDNDDVDPPLELRPSENIPSGFIPPNVEFRAIAGFSDGEFPIIDTTKTPIREETDEAGRPIPYFVRIKVDDNAGNVVNAYAAGRVRILGSANDVVDLLSVGGTVAGTIFQGFNGDAFDVVRGSHAGNAMTTMGDMDQDGNSEFALTSGTATPFNRNQTGIGYLIYGRARKPDLTQNFAQGRYSGVLALNTVGTFVPFPPEDPFFQVFYNVRGTQLFHPVEGGGSAGLSSICMWPDITGDTTAEVVIGAPLCINVDDRTDQDPCDGCQFPTPPNPQFLCYGDLTIATPQSPITGEIILADVVPAGIWSPFDPPANGGFVNVDIDQLQDQAKLVNMTGFGINLSGTVLPTVKVLDFEPMPPGGQTDDAAAQFTVTRVPALGGALPETDIGVADSFNRSSGQWGIDLAPGQRITITFGPRVFVLSSSISAYFVRTGANTSGQMVAFSRDLTMPNQVRVDARPTTSFGDGNGFVNFPPPVDANGDPVDPFVVDRIEITRGGTTAGSLVSLDDFRFTFIGDFFVDVQLESSEGPLVENLLVQIEPDGSGAFQDQQVVVPVGTFPLSLNMNGQLNGVPPSVYDGQFAVFVRPDANVTFDQTQVEISGATAPFETRQFAWQYFDLFPDEISTQSCSPDAGDIWVRGARRIDPACPLRAFQYNDDGSSTFGISGYLCNDFRVGQISSPSDQNKASQDFIYLRGTPYNTDYASGLVYVAAGDAMLLPPFGAGAGLRTVDLGGFGQNVNLPGARFRGAWLGGTAQPHYDPANRFGETVDTMPDVNDTGGGRNELIVSAPGTGVLATAVADVGATLTGAYSLAGTASRTFVNAVLTDLNGNDLGFNAFSRVIDARLVLTLQFPDGQPDGPSPKIRVSARSPLTGQTISQNVMLWNRGDTDFQGDLTIDDYLHDAQNNQLQVALPPLEIDQLLTPTGRTTSGVDISVAILPDCTIAPTSFVISGATWRVTGLAPNHGMVKVFDGQNYTTPGLAGTPGNGVASWPIPQCTGQNPIPAGPRRGITPGEGAIPTPVSEILGRRPNDQLGWSHYAGDINRDGISDFACGAPFSDLDPLDITNANRYREFEYDSGTAYVLFGTRALGSGVVGPPFERIEVRGTHTGDHLGRVQGGGGYFRGPTVPGQEGRDVFFGCPDYDANTNLGEADPNPSDSYAGFPLVPVFGQNVPQVGTDAGMVAVLFGSDTLTGERTLRVEQIGTGNFFGVKFFGGQAEARLGQSVSSAGDFNRDGNDDILMTAPGQRWPGVRVVFSGEVADGQQISINGRVFEFDTSGKTPPEVSASAVGIDVSGMNSAGQPRTNATDAEAALRAAMKTLTYEALGVGAVLSRSNFPEPQLDVPTTTFLARQPASLSLTTTAPNVSVTSFTRLGVTYMIFGQAGNALLNKMFVLPQDLNRRDASGNRVLKGIAFISPYETPGGEIAISFGGRDEDPQNSTERGITFGDASAFVSIGQPANGAINNLAVANSPFRSSTGVNSSNGELIAFGYDIPAGKTEVFNFGTRRTAQLNFFLAIGEGATQVDAKFFDSGGLLLRTETITVMAGQNASRFVQYGSTSCIAKMTIEVTGVMGRAAIDDLRVLTGSPEDSPAEVVANLGDIDGDGFPDCGIAAPRADFFNVLEPCNRRREAGEVYLIYGNRFGLSDGAAP